MRQHRTREEARRDRRARREGAAFLGIILLACWLPGWVDMLFLRLG